ncbi:MAG TPA: condensation domain-containing protein, partial [Pyrinomonadaceae bacterium]|nr:condensation domain-containing protein [Pyrinomonadaceae bacterium]
DAATFDIWGALLNGGRVAVMPPGPISVEELTKVLKRDQVTTIFLTTALFNLMVQEQPAALACVPEVLSGGEQHSTIHIKNHLAAMTEAGTTDTCRFMNAYGPTEVTTFSTTETITANPATISMGRPIANTTTYVLDAQLRPVPVGVYGELYLGGLGLARGYYGQTSLTAERFIPDVFSGEQGARLYRTGDVVRQLADGRIEFLGRRDHQIKLRGFRIELGEIETALTHSEGVRQAVVLMREDTPGDKRLVAYIVPETEEFSIAELRRHLHTELPEYMVPAAFVLLDELPLNPNGKVNRQLLPEPARSERTEQEREPRTLVEEILAGIWSEVLGLDHVGVDEDFFELGGHSLLAVRVASRVRTALDYELPLRAIFEAPTLAALAARIEEERQRASGVSLPPITPALREGPMPLSFAQERLWFIDRLDEGSAVYNLSTAVKLEGSLQITALEQSLTELVRRHEILRTSFVEIDGQPAQVMAATMSLPLRVTNLKRIENGESATAQVIAQETAPAFDLTRLPLMRARLVQLSDREHALVLTFHHIITDGWSMRVLVKELTTLYAAFSNGEPSPLPDLTLQYADYSAWQQRWLLGEVLDQQLAYWKQQLDGAPELLELPLDHPRPQLRRYRGAVQSRRLSATLSKELRRLSRSNGSTLFMTLLATFQLMLSRYSGQEDIVVGAPSAGRSRTELEGQIGFFINTLALRTDLSGNPSFLELLTRVRKMTLEAFAHQDAPFEKLLEELQVARDLSRTPLIQVFFNMLNLPSPQADLSELRITPLSQEAGAKFDLTFYIADGRDGLHFNLVYDADLFEPSRMTEMLEQFECLLEQIVAEPNRELANFSLVSSRARALLPEPTLPLEPTWPGAVHQLFTQQAKRTPNQTAVVDSQSIWSYLELDRRSNQLARHLHAKGIRANDVVAIYGERSARLVCALLGALKAGAAFMILDPANPDSYLDECLRVAQPRYSLQLNEIDALTDSDDDVDIDTIANDLAYIAFTSGSTGTPKGIAGEHGPLAHFVEWHAHTFDLHAGDRFSMLSGLSHDPLLRDIFTPLSVGATLCIPETVAGGRLADWIT